jgi:hypothetical protein
MGKLTARDPQTALPDMAERPGGGVITERPPLPYRAAAKAEICCAAATARLLRHRRIHVTRNNGPAH